MRKTGTIIFHLLFLLEVSFCFGSGHLFPDPIQPVFTELSDQNSSAGQSLISDNESLNEDQIPQAATYFQFPGPQLQTTTNLDAFLIPNPYQPIWQPPKL
jgi:hypothetical protein